MELNNFINRLKLDILAKVRIIDPIHLGRAMDLVQRIEEKLVLITLSVMNYASLRMRWAS